MTRPPCVDEREVNARRHFGPGHAWVRAGSRAVAEEPLDLGEMVVCHHRKGRVVAVERHLAV